MAWYSLSNSWTCRPHARKRRPFRPRRPEVEYLEERLVFNNGLGQQPVLLPAGSPPQPATQAQFVTGLYYDLLHREPAASEVAATVAFLQAGGTQQQVIADFLNSPEYRSDFIRITYTSYLQRPPEAGVTPAWLALMQQGMTSRQVQALVLASNEYYLQNGANPVGWLDGVYRDLFSTAPDASSLESAVADGQNVAWRYQMALELLQSPQEDQLLIDAAYQDLLGRAPDAGGAAAALAAMEQGMTPDQLTSDVVSSPEYAQDQAAANLPVVGAVSSPEESAQDGGSGQPAQGTGTDGNPEEGAQGDGSGDGASGSTGDGNLPGSGFDGDVGGGAGAGGLGGAGGQGGGDVNNNGGAAAGDNGGAAGNNGGAGNNGAGNPGNAGGVVGAGGDGLSSGDDNSGGLGGAIPGGSSLGSGAGGGGGVGGLGGAQGGGTVGGGSSSASPGGGAGGGTVIVGGGTAGSDPSDPPPAPLLPNINVSNQPSEDWAEISMAVNPTNPNNIVILGTRVSDVTLDAFYSLDGGATWTDVRVDSTFDGFTGSNVLRGDPTIKFDATGRLYLAYLVDTDDTSLTSGNSVIEVGTSTDGGKTYTAVTALSESKASGIFDDKELLGIGIAPGDPTKQYAYIGFTHFANLDQNNQTSVPEIIGSTDGGATWSAPTVVGDPTDTNTQFCQPVVGPNGQIDVSFEENNVIEFKSSPTFVNGTFSFPADTPVTTLNNTSFVVSIPAQPSRGISSIPVLAVDDSTGPYRGNIYIAYADLPSPNAPPANFDIFVVTSSNGGATWSLPTRVNDDATTNSHFNPWIEVDPITGIVVLAWRDARLDPNNDKVDIFASTSTNGGASFTPNVRISAASSDESANSQPGLNNFLEYDGLAAFNGTAYFAWSDNSADPDGNKAIFFATLPISSLVTGGGGGGPGVILLSSNPYGPNQTSDTAHNFGLLLPGTLTLDDLTINNSLTNGLPNYDWYLWTISQAGTVTVTIHDQPVAGGSLQLRLYTLDSQGDLVPLGSSLTLGTTTQQVSVLVAAGELFYVEVYGFDYAQANYEMTVSLT